MATKTRKPSIPYGWLYFIYGDGKIKMGITKDPLIRRLRNMQGQSPSILTMVGAINKPINQLEKIETDLHQRFAVLWSHGEWFYDSPDIREFIGKYAQEFELRVSIKNANLERLEEH